MVACDFISVESDFEREWPQLVPQLTIELIQGVDRKEIRLHESRVNKWISGREP